MNNKILVLGATGNIGTFLIQDLKKKNADFTAGVPFEELDKLKRVGVHGIPLDLGDRFSLEKGFKGFNTIFLLLPMVEPLSSWGQNVIEAAKRNGITFIVRSSLIDSSPDSPHFLFKAHGGVDKMLRDSGIPYCIVHPNSFMQNFVAFHAGSINSSGTFSFPYGDSRISYVDVRDIAAVDAAILADPASHQNKEYTLTGPRALSSGDIAGILSNASGRMIRYVPVDENRFEQGLHKGGMTEWEIKAVMSLGRHIMEDKQSLLSDDVKKVTGSAPISFEVFAKDYARVWRKVLTSV